MLRTFLATMKCLCVAPAIAIAAGATLEVRAETPANPLRPIASTLAASELAQDQHPTLVRVPESPPSIVPRAFGQPELLPAPASEQPLDLKAGFDPAALDDSAWQQFVHPLFDEPWFAHSDPNDPHRHIGIGQPLVGTSWRNRPWFFGTFVGGVMMDDLVPNRIYQNDTTFVGARLGYDFDHFWGLEWRWAFARPDLADQVGAPLNPASRDNFADVSLIYYPLGDARWRPYLSAGLGFVTFRFNNEFGERVSEAVLDVPLGIGVKYFYGPWFSLRFDVTDNLSLGNDRISGMHNISLMCGAEFRFGGRRPSYFPWHNNTSYW